MDGDRKFIPVSLDPTYEMSVENRDAVIDDYFEAIDRADPGIVEPSLDEAFRYESPAGDLEGAGGLRRYVEELRSMSNSTHEVTLRVHDGDVAVAEGVVTGEGAEGEPVSRRFVDVFEFDGDSGALARVGVYVKDG